MFPPSGSSRLQSFSQWSTPSPYSTVPFYIYHKGNENQSPTSLTNLERLKLGNVFSPVTKAKMHCQWKHPHIPVICPSSDDGMGVERRAFLLPLVSPWPFLFPPAPRSLLGALGLVL